MLNSPFVFHIARRGTKIEKIEEKKTINVFKKYFVIFTCSCGLKVHSEHANYTSSLVTFEWLLNFLDNLWDSDHLLLKQ